MLVPVQRESPPATHAGACVRDGGLYAAWADCAEDIRDAQRLRRKVFFDELGAHAANAQEAALALDVDRFDAFCDHLLVKVRDAAGADDDQVVGTYRVLSPEAARRAGGYYTETEFDLRPFHALHHGPVELGRSCVHRDWRRGGVIMMLWTALGAYMQERGLDTLIGCCSVALTDNGANARHLWTVLSRSHLVAEPSRVTPRTPFDVGRVHGDPAAAPPSALMPALMKGYLRCGARVLGAPAHDAAFNTADFPMMLCLDALAPSYRQHFVGTAG